MPDKNQRLLQDETQTADSKKLSQWFASRPDARLRAREAAVAKRRLSTDAEFVLDLLVAAGHITREKAFQCRDIALAHSTDAVSMVND